MLLALALSAAAALPAGAQRLRTRIAPPPPPPAPSSTRTPPRSVAASATHHSFLRTALYGAGGAVLGGWGGYLTSQIVWSDWQEISRPGGIDRMRYTLTGAAIGTVIGAVIGYHGSGSAPGRPVFGTRPAITAEQIRASSAHNVLDLVQLLRPQWLNPRGNDIVQINDSTAAPIPGADPTDVLRVYMDGELLGGPDQLADIPTPQVERVEYYDMRAATLRWGAGHSHGAINVIMSRGQS